MPPAGTSQTPSTARKRARCQATATGSLSLLAVPKLKAGDPVPTAEAVTGPGAVAGPGGLHSRPATKQKPEVLQEPTKCSQSKSARVSTGKENLPAGFSSPATFVGHTSGSSASLLRPSAKATGQAKCPADKLQQSQVHSRALASSASPRKASRHCQLPTAMDVTKASHKHAAAQRAARHAGGAAAAAQAKDAAQAASHLHASTTKPVVVAAASRSTATDGTAESKEDQLDQEDVPLACHTAINKRRRPVEQARRYGDWYTGNDTDLDEHLHEYNAEHKHAAATTENTLSRRNSALPSYTADMDDSDYAEDEEQKSVRRVSRLRRSTIAPGQDTAAQVAAMTAELSRLADDMLPQEEQAAQCRPGRGHKQGHKQGGKGLRQRLLDSWDGKTYYERLQAEAEDQDSTVAPASAGQQQAQQLAEGQLARTKAKSAAQMLDTIANKSAPGPASSQACAMVSSELKPMSEAQQQVPLSAAAEGKTAVKTARLKQSSKLPPRSASHQSVQQKQQAALPQSSIQTHAQNAQSQQQQQNTVDAQVGKSSRQQAQKAQKQQQQQKVDDAQIGTASRQQAQKAQEQQQQQKAVDVEAGKASKQVKSADNRQTQQGNIVSRGSNDAASNAQSYQAATSSSQQRQRVRTQSKKADTAAADAVVAAPSAVATDRLQQPGSGAANSPQEAALSKPPAPGGDPTAGAGALHTSEGTVTAVTGPVTSGTMHQHSPAEKGTTNDSSTGGHAGSSSQSAVRGADRDSSREGHAGSSNQSQCAANGVDKDSSAGQQQVARLTAANTALLSDLVDMQGAVAVLEQQLRAENNTCLAAEKDKARLAKQLEEEKEARRAAEQQVTLLQQNILELRAQYAQLSLQMQAPTASISQDRLNAVRHHAAALAEAAAAMELAGIEG